MKIIYILQSYNEKVFIEEGKENLKDFCQIEVYAKSEQEAIEKAKRYIKKKEYRIAHIIEK